MPQAHVFGTRKDGPSESEGIFVSATGPALYFNNFLL